MGLRPQYQIQQLPSPAQCGFPFTAQHSPALCKCLSSEDFSFRNKTRRVTACFIRREKRFVIVTLVGRNGILSFPQMRETAMQQKYISGNTRNLIISPQGHRPQYEEAVNRRHGALYLQMSWWLPFHPATGFGLLRAVIYGKRKECHTPLNGQ